MAGRTPVRSPPVEGGSVVEGPAFLMTPVSVESLFIPVLLRLDSNPSHTSVRVKFEPAVGQR